MKKRLLIFNDFFFPAYKAGGPIQSLINLIIQLGDVYDISVITSACDLNESVPMQGIESGKWQSVQLPGANTEINVWYLGLHENAKQAILHAVEELKPSVVYLNGMFTYRFVILPLMIIKNTKVVICPRGMIQEGALSGKYIKKKIYLSVLNWSGYIKNVWWHATTDVEAQDIKTIFGNNAKVIVAGNIPRKPLDEVSYPNKEKGKLRLIYLSLITAKKNLIQAIEAINHSNADITLDIYGPVKDVQFWEKCETAIKRSNGSIQYKGDVKPALVQSTFSKYDAGIFLTKAENFGHALYESLSSGRPIITSFFTPWDDLENKNAGWNVDINDLQNIISVLDKAAALSKEAFQPFCIGAHSIANNYYNQGFNIHDYKKLF